ncbi:MAG: DUF4347 domain-containing protein [Cyanobacteria bacterium P01_G01_bin.19]
MSQVTLSTNTDWADVKTETLMNRPLVIIDSHVSQLLSLVRDIQYRANLVILDPQQDGIEQITQALKKYSKLSSLHLITHGSPGCVYLGNSKLNFSNIDDYSQQLKSWAKFLTGKNLLVYGCQVAKEQGQIFLEQLSRLTKSNIAASRKTIGSTEYGRYWQLEFQVGLQKINNLIFSQSLQDSYKGAFVNFDEAIEGDISNDPNDPLGLTLEAGTNTISATTVPGEVDQEYITVTVPERFQLDTVVLDSFSTPGNVAFIGVQEGEIFTEPLDDSADTANLLGFALFGETGEEGTNILDDIGDAVGTIGFDDVLDSGTYTFALQQLGTSSEYTLDFNVSEVVSTPETEPSPESDSDSIEVVVTVESLAPDAGNFVTPVWVGFHNGEFDLYNRGEAVTPGLESLAEDGSVDLLSQEFADSGFGSLDGAVLGTEGLEGPIDPGEVASATFTIDLNDPASQFFSYASMIIPSNDAFVANGDPSIHNLFDAEGNFIGADFIVSGSEVLDAGTEVNDELAENTAFFSQAEPNTGEDENGVVEIHPGFIEGGRILSEDGSTEGAPAAFTNADFTADGYEVFRITVEEVVTQPEPEPEVPIEGDPLESVFGTLDSDTIELIGSNQIVFAGDDNDLIDATTGEGNNRILAGSGDDTLILGGSDRILAGEGDDAIFATSGGDNTITGGAGVDQFWIASAEIPDAANIITDFTSGEDVIGIAGLGIDFADLSITAVENDVLISANDSDLAILSGVTADSLSESDFAFA